MLIQKSQRYLGKVTLSPFPSLKRKRVKRIARKTAREWEWERLAEDYERNTRCPALQPQPNAMLSEACAPSLSLVNAVL
jgi:hypothetical protein